MEMYTPHFNVIPLNLFMIVGNCLNVNIKIFFILNQHILIFEFENQKNIIMRTYIVLNIYLTFTNVVIYIVISDITIRD